MSTPNPQQQQQQQQSQKADNEKIYQWINELCMPATREMALVELRFVYFFFS
jgi:hypothetical protein